MASYAIVAFSRDIRVRTCWILEAHSAQSALDQAWHLRNQGFMPWLPATVTLQARKPSRLERAQYEIAIKQRMAGGGGLGGEEAVHRSQRLAAAFFEKMWREAA